MSTRGSVGACLLLTAASLCGQQFEAAAVKIHTDASPSTGRSGIEETPGLIRIENLSLRIVIGTAYGAKDFQIEGPGWLAGEAVEITAKPPAEYKHDQLQALLRNLLSERFKLAVHHETKEIAAFALVVSKGGSKLVEATQPRNYFTARPGLIECTRVSMADLANALARFVDRPVADPTGLTATYEIKVEWTPDKTGSDPIADTPDPGLTLVTALSEQLGLRLQTQRVPVDMVVVDHIERSPIEN